MSNVGRVITLVIEIQTEQYPQWIFDAHVSQKSGGTNDIIVKKIAEGDSIKKLEELEDQTENDRLEGLEEYD